MKRILLLSLLLLLTILIVQSEAETILLPDSSWEYTFSDPTGTSSWNTTYGGWSTGLAPFGNMAGAYGPDINGDFSYNTYWPADNSGSLDDDLWVRTQISLTGYDLSTLLWSLGVDNGFKLYVNGNLVYDDNAEGYTYRWEYGGSIPEAFLLPGDNVIALALEDHGYATAFDMQITGAPQNRVPEPSTFLLLGAGLAGVGLMRTRFKRQPNK